MRLFSKDLPAGRSYMELQKKVNEKVSERRRDLDEYGNMLKQYEANSKERIEDLSQKLNRLEGLERLDQLEKLDQLDKLEALEAIKTGQEEDFRFLKEKQDYVLRNFPTLEANIIEKVKGVQSEGYEELAKRLTELEEKQNKRNVWTKVLLWFALLCSFLSAGGIIVTLLNLAGYIVF